MPLYEFRCRSCDAVFERRLPHDARHDQPACPAGHTDTVRLLSSFATTRAAAAPVASCGAPVPGGCGGGGCGCHAG